MALFAAVAELAEELGRETGRLKKRAAIVGAISAVHAQAPESDDAGLFALYLAGTPFAEADSRKLNAGGALLSKALLRVSGANDIALTAAYRKHGDMGAAAFDLLVASSAEKKPELTLVDVADAFAAMAVAKTTAIRAALVEEMLRRATPLEAKYLLKLMLGDMRIGVKQSLVEEAIAVAASVPVEAVRTAVMLEADLVGAVRRAFAGTLDEARMRLFHPLGFMLASPVESPEEAVERFTEKPAKVVVVKEKKSRKKKENVAVASPEDEEANANADFFDKLRTGSSTRAARIAHDNNSVGDVDERPIEAFLEDKYDGMRAQVHCGDADQPGRVAIYSRNREDVTESFPELEEAFAHVLAERDWVSGLGASGCRMSGGGRCP
jgi:DNA ligase-1